MIRRRPVRPSLTADAPRRCLSAVFMHGWCGGLQAWFIVLLQHWGYHVHREIASLANVHAAWSAPCNQTDTCMRTRQYRVSFDGTNSPWKGTVGQLELQDSRSRGDPLHLRC